MRRVIYHRRAAKALGRIPAARAKQVLAAVDELALLDAPTEHSNVKMMRGGWQGSLRLRVGDYRVVFELPPGSGCEELAVLLVTHVGSRGAVYG